MYRMNVPVEEKNKVLRINPFFSILDSAQCSELVTNFQAYHFDLGETIFMENSPCAGFHFIQQGSVKLYKSSPHGREIVMRILTTGAVFNEVAVLDGGVNPVSALAQEASHVWILEREIFLMCLEMQPDLTQKILQDLCLNLRSVTTLVGELSFYQIICRLARFLVKLPPEQLSGTGSHRFTQEKIATYLGTVREVVARSLRELERSGAIKVSRTGIQVIDAEILNVWAQMPSNRGSEDKLV